MVKIFVASGIAFHLFYDTVQYSSRTIAKAPDVGSASAVVFYHNERICDRIKVKPERVGDFVKHIIGRTIIFISDIL